MEAKQLVQALPQILKEIWAGLKQQDWQGTFGTSVLTLKSETAAAKLYMSIIENSGPYPAE
jgi:hypothetical protein